MKSKYMFFAGWTAVLLLLALSSNIFAYSVILPDIPPTPPLPYPAEQDHYSGPACAQMILNSCPNTAARHYNSQDDIYSVIMLNNKNSEPAVWFSDPQGMVGVLYNDKALSPCGHWGDYSNTDKFKALGQLLGYMDSWRYLMPVSIGSSEHWVTVFGFWTDVKPPYPNPSNPGPVTLQYIYFYDPLPGQTGYSWVSGTAWTTNSFYWGVPFNSPASSWHNKYLAVLEPPKFTPVVIVKDWVRRGRILPVDSVKQSYAGWLTTMKEKKLIPKPFEALCENSAIETPVLVQAADYAYYLIPLKNRRLAAIFNAYDGSFEELRLSQQERGFVIDPRKMRASIVENMRSQRMELVETSAPVMRYDPKVAAYGRFSPVWETQVVVKDRTGKKQQIPVLLDQEGAILKGVQLSRPPVE
jgi:hypothetical protein